MNKKKIIFYIITVSLLLISSIGIYCSYDIMQSEKKKPNFSNNNILYDVLENVYSLSFQLDNVSKKEGISKYITANKDATDAFYHDAILYSREISPEKKNTKYYAEGNNNSLGNTNDDLKTLQSNHTLQNKYQWYLKLSFDENGNISYDSLGCKKSQNLNFSLVWNNFKQTYFQYLESYDDDYILHNPTNLTVYFAIPAKLATNSMDSITYYSGLNSTTTNLKNILPIASIAVGIVCLYILVCPYTIEKEIAIFHNLTKIKFEILISLIIIGFSGIIITLYGLMIDTLNGYYLEKLVRFVSKDYSEIILAIMNIASWATFLFLCMFSVYYLKTIFNIGLTNVLKNDTVCVWLFKTIKKYINKINSFDFNSDSNKLLIKIILINCLIISIICCFFVYGIVLALIYSIILFIIFKKKLDEFKKDYQILLNAFHKLSHGDFNVAIYDDIGIFNSLGHEFSNIKDSFEKAVNKEVKSQKMKTELITNVSHDLKTPLTSIITYIDLLKDENLDANKRKDYIATLDHNSLRLKNLIDDLFEISKINSGNVKLNIVDVDIIALVQQAKFELNDYFEKKHLIFKTNYPNKKIILPLDSLKTYRIFENLLINISRYTLDNTRVYIDIIDYSDCVEIIFKNISANEIKISEDRLVERFVQGDISRNNKGSGLGLAIAKSFTELQNGIFKIKVDGDLFKAIVIFKK